MGERRRATREEMDTPHRAAVAASDAGCGASAPSGSAPAPADPTRHGVSHATLARLAAGYSVKQVAKLTRYSPEAIRLTERGGGRTSFNLACTLARLYKCSGNVFLYSTGSDMPGHLSTINGKRQRGLGR